MRCPAWLLGLLALSCGGSSTRPAAGSADAAFEGDAARIYQAYLDARPTRAAHLGFHQYDGRLPDVSPAGFGAETAGLTEARTLLENIDPATLSEEHRIEREVLLREIRDRLFELDAWKRPYRDPSFYLGALDVVYYVARDYAPLAERTAGIARLCQGAGAYLAQARANVAAVVPRTWLELAILQTSGQIDFYKEQVPAEAGAACIAALEVHRKHLEGQRAAANDAFALGPELFLRMLRETEGVDLDLATLQQIADADLARNLAAIEAAARQIDPSKTTAEVVALVMADRPAPADLLAEATRQAADTRAFLIDHHIVTIPSEDVAEVRESPPFERWNGASLDAAGPFEARSLPAFYYISPPDPQWSEEEQRAYIPPRAPLLFTTVHEVWPGHFLQDLHQRRHRSRILRTFFSYAMGEGWAHYTEEMMWDAGLGGGDPRARIGMLVEALMRNVRFVSALGLHTGGMTVEQSTALFEEKAFLDKASARQQAARGTFDPMYLSYTVGKLMIVKLREDWKAKVGDGYSLQAFHDQFLSYGCPPVPVIRRAMLGDGAGAPL